ncbi:type II secretion system protein GspL [Sphingomonas sp. 28-63-12]|uniref:type II secretion system protein GspL n=1 Tax=Sphingomonas sp. 28-63-12 TaxID=1970434 RepID=UPI000BCF3ECF|nr:MAG: general secretion pathway protein GspL [Sphingomonas sp. 28-63-12]
MTTNVVFLPTSTEDNYRWLRIGDGVIAARGEGIPTGDGSPSIVVVPAEDVTLHWASLPDRSAAQSVAAARLLVAEASAAPIGALHVAVGREEQGEERPIGVVTRLRMQRWLVDLAAAGVDPEAMIPSPMLLPRPAEGYLRADLGGDHVVRGVNAGFADDQQLTVLVTGGVEPTVMAREAIEAAIVAAVTTPPLDLRQGLFAKSRRFDINWSLIRRLSWLMVAILTVSLFISIVQIMQYGFTADAIERRADLLARQGLARGETVNDASRQLDARLVRMRGAGMGFSTTAAAVFAAIRAVPGSEVRGIAFDQKGQMDVNLVAQTQGQVLDVVRQIEAQGFGAEPSTFEQGTNRLSGRITVKPK